MQKNIITDNTLFDGLIDMEQIAIERIRMFEPKEGYWEGDSGGKDSEVTRHLVIRTGVKSERHHSLTTVDAPQTIWHIRKYHPETIIDIPEIPLMKMMIKKGIPPMRQRRWCCGEYKEKGGAGRTVITGIRSAESAKRAKRKMVEPCFKDKLKTFVNPIFDWTDADVWKYINHYKIPVNPLYKPPYNFKRVGCVLCPMVRDIERQFKFFPKLCEAWHKAIIRLYNDRVAKGKPVNHKNGEDFWKWWLNRDAKKIQPDQTIMFE